MPSPRTNSVVVKPANATKPQNPNACITPTRGRSRTTRTWKTTSSRILRRREPTCSTLKLFDARAIKRTRAAICQTKMPTKTRKRIRTIQTSSMSALQRGHHRGHHFEEVPGNPVIGHLEDRRLGILVDGDDGARPFHADEMLDRARNPE